MRKTYLLHRDGSVTKTKSLITELQQKGELNSVQYLLIPVPRMRSVYIAVDGSYLNGISFGHAEVTYHMRMAKYHTMATAARSDKVRIEYSYDYNVTTMHCDCWEEFYNAIHNAFTAHYVERIQNVSDDNDMAHYLEVSDFRSAIFDPTGKKIEEYIYQASLVQQDVPFETSSNEILCAQLADRYELLSRELPAPVTIVLYEKDQGKVRWRNEGNSPIQLYSDVVKVLVGNGWTSTYLMMTDDEYDIALKMKSGMGYFTCLDYCSSDYPKEEPPYEHLTITTRNQIPRYQFNDTKSDDVVHLEDVCMLYENYLLDVYTTVFYDPWDICIAIEYLPYIMDILRENVKVHQCMVFETDEIVSLQYWSTIISELIIDLDERTPRDRSFSIITDSFQDHQPALKEVCYLLNLEEKTP